MISFFSSRQNVDREILSSRRASSFDSSAISILITSLFSVLLSVEPPKVIVVEHNTVHNGYGNNNLLFAGGSTERRN